MKKFLGEAGDKEASTGLLVQQRGLCSPFTLLERLFSARSTSIGSKMASVKKKNSFGMRKAWETKSEDVEWVWPSTCLSSQMFGSHLREWQESMTGGKLVAPTTPITGKEKNTSCILSIYTASTSTMTALTELTEGEEEADLCELDLPLALGQQHPARALLLVLLLELG